MNKGYKHQGQLTNVANSSAMDYAK